MSKKSIEVTLVQVLEPLRAEPGDQLMILNDKVVGVYTGLDPKKAEAGRMGGAAKAENKKQGEQKYPRLKEDDRDALRARVVEYLAKNPNQNLRMIGQGLGFKPGTPAYTQLGRQLRDMVYHRLLNSHRPTNYNADVTYRVPEADAA
jgi:hypothetical protein